MTELTITPTLRDGVHVLVVEGEIDAASVHVLQTALDRQHDVPVVADLSLLSFIDSAGLHALFRAAEEDHLAAIVRTPASNVSRVLAVVDIGKSVRLFDDLAAAIKHINERAA